MKESIEKSMDSVAEALLESQKHDLDTEVVTWGLLAMKENPNLTISEAISHGFNEWVK